MAYKQSVYLKAKAALDARRSAAEQEARRRYDEVAKKCPELDAIDREMAACGAEAVRCVARGDDGQACMAALSQKNLALQQERRALLERNGFRADYLEDVYTCPVCKDTGTHGNYYCKCYLRLIRETAKAQIKAAQLCESTFDTFDLRYYPDAVDPQLGKSPRQIMTAVLSFFKTYAETFTPSAKGLLLLGKTGLGKTHLSLALVNRLIDRGFNVYYDSAQNLMDRLERNRFSNKYDDEELNDDIYESDLLIIDDLGTEFSTSFTVAAMYNIINNRINSGLPTILNSNLLLPEIEARYSQRFTSRIVGACDVVEFHGRDIRQQKIHAKF